MEEKLTLKSLMTPAQETGQNLNERSRRDQMILENFLDIELGAFFEAWSPETVQKYIDLDVYPYEKKSLDVMYKNCSRILKQERKYAEEGRIGFTSLGADDMKDISALRLGQFFCFLNEYCFSVQKLREYQNWKKRSEGRNQGKRARKNLAEAQFHMLNYERTMGNAQQFIYSILMVPFLNYRLVNNKQLAGAGSLEKVSLEDFTNTGAITDAPTIYWLTHELNCIRANSIFRRDKLEALIYDFEEKEGSASFLKPFADTPASEIPYWAVIRIYSTKLELSWGTLFYRPKDPNYILYNIIYPFIAMEETRTDK